MKNRPGMLWPVTTKLFVKRGEVGEMVFEREDGLS